MTEVRPTQHQHLAIEAKLNMLLGAAVYDRHFVGLQVLSVKRGVLNAHVAPEQTAAIEGQYSLHLAIVVESVLKCAVKSVTLNSRPKRPQTS